jgi:hypothetical protein
MVSTSRRKQYARSRRVHLRLETLEDRRLLNRSTDWTSFAHDPQHTGLSFVASQSLDTIRWQTPMDLSFQLLTHEGSPVITAANTVIVPVKNQSVYVLEGHRGDDGTLLWTAHTEYNGPTFAPVLTPFSRVYFPGPGGTVYYIDHPDDPGATISGQLAFYGIDHHDANLDSTVNINTPLTVDRNGTIYFGFTAVAGNDLNLQNGIARMDINGDGTWIAASDAAGDGSITRVARMCAPAQSNDGNSLYVAVSGMQKSGYLVQLDSATLQPLARVQPKDVVTGRNAAIDQNSSATPMVGPDGDVYYGVLENPSGSNGQRGWMEHYSADLSQTKLPGAFGWDTTASVVPRRMVPSYTGTSSYLIVTKYNHYARNVYQIGLLDPNASEVDPDSGATVMNEVQTVNGPTSGREWCINDAAVDLSTGSILANSEDGKLYRWDLNSNMLSQTVRLDAGVGEAYTPTLIGPDGTVYSINDGILFAVGAANNRAIATAPATGFLVSASVLPFEPGTGFAATLATVDSATGDSVMLNAFALANEQGPLSHSSDGMNCHPTLHQTVQDPFEGQDLFV